MRQLFWSTDIYCQNVNNREHGESSYLYSNRKKGKKASCRRDRERERERERERVCARDGEWLKIELASVVKTSVGERLTILG